MELGVFCMSALQTIHMVYGLSVIVFSGLPHEVSNVTVHANVNWWT